MKLVINNCYGGFSLSREAVLLARSLTDDPSKLKDEWVKKILKKTGSQSDVDSIRDYLGVTWNV